MLIDKNEVKRPETPETNGDDREIRNRLVY